MTTITEAEVRFRTHTHHHNHHTVIAVSRVDGQGIAAARCIRHEARQTAEVEVSVDDAWQGRGIGSELVRRVVEHARSQGVRRIVIALPV